MHGMPKPRSCIHREVDAVLGMLGTLYQPRHFIGWNESMDDLTILGVKARQMVIADVQHVVVKYNLIPFPWVLDLRRYGKGPSVKYKHPASFDRDTRPH
jgi:hypothetical protein